VTVLGTVEGLRAELQSIFPNYDVAVALSADGADAVAAFDGVWVAAAARPLLLAHPGKVLDLEFELTESEPFHQPPDPVWAGDPWQRNHGAGTVRFRPRGEETGTIRRVVRTPSANLWNGQGGHSGPPIEGSSLRRLALRAYKEIEPRVPLLLDVTRQKRNTTLEAKLNEVHPSMQAVTVSGADARNGAVPTCWVAMHWLEAGGAESWAFEQARLAAEAGYHVVITADRGAPQRLVARALEITPDVQLIGQSVGPVDFASYIAGFLGVYTIELVLIHHSAMAYRWIPDLRLAYPRAKIIDSTHIVEHRTGGFVRQSIERSHQIDLHHVISPELRDRYVLGAGIDAAKVVYRPLTGTHNLAGSEPAPRSRADGPLRLGFLGRLVQQKRPYVFLELAKRLRRRDAGAYRFVMQGSGAQEAIVAKRVNSFGLAGVLERRSWGPVESFFEDVDVLVITSDNEGLTLTALEADTAGVLVLSADVGSQRTVIARRALLPRDPLPFLREATKLLEAISADRALFDSLLMEQHQLVTDLRGIETATSYFTDLFAEYRKANS